MQVMIDRKTDGQIGRYNININSMTFIIVLKPLSYTLKNKKGHRRATPISHTIKSEVNNIVYFVTMAPLKGWDVFECICLCPAGSQTMLFTRHTHKKILQQQTISKTSITTGSVLLCI